MNIKFHPVHLLVLHIILVTMVHLTISETSPTIQWIAPKIDDDFMKNVEPSGYSNQDSKEFFHHVARLTIDGSFLCAQYLMLGHKVAYPLKGKQVTEKAYESNHNVQILEFPDASVSWVNWDDKKNLDRLSAVECGVWPSTTETTYACRAEGDQNHLVIGAFVPSTKSCFATVPTDAKGGKEQEFKEFEVLTQNFHGAVRDSLL